MHAILHGTLEDTFEVCVTNHAIGWGSQSCLSCRCCAAIVAADTAGVAGVIGVPHSQQAAGAQAGVFQREAHASV